MARVRSKSRPKLALVALVSLAVGSFVGLLYAATKGEPAADARFQPTPHLAHVRPR